MIELRNVAIASPESIKDILELLVDTLVRVKTNKAAEIPPRKEKRGNKKIDELEIPRAIVTTAPVAAPDETPIILGSAIGFLNIPCKVAPETDRAEPTSKAIKILGSRMLVTTCLLTSSTSRSPTKPFVNIEIVS